MEQSFNDITKSVDQLCHQLSLANIVVPRFDDNRNVFDFLAEFESVTTIVPDEVKALLLRKAFPLDETKAWFKTTLEPAIKEGKPFVDLKKLIIERFSDLGDRDRHFKKLKEAKFDEKSNRRLLDFVEDLIYSYRKAHGDKFDEESCVKFIKASLPNQLVPKLNLIQGFKSSISVSTLVSAIKEFDSSFRNAEINSDAKIPTTELMDLLKQLIKKSDATQAVVAALQLKVEDKLDRPTRRDDYPNAGSSQTRLDNRERSPSWDRKRQFSPRRQRSPDGRQYDERNNNRRQERRYSPIPSRDKSPRRSPSPVRNFNQRGSSTQTNEDEVFERYCNRHGKPTRPCKICKGMHWDKHCPIHLNA